MRAVSARIRRQSQTFEKSARADDPAPTMTARWTWGQLLASTL
jgi:hypothetical protein